MFYFSIQFIAQVTVSDASIYAVMMNVIAKPIWPNWVIFKGILQYTTCYTIKRLSNFTSASALPGKAT